MPNKSFALVYLSFTAVVVSYLMHCNPLFKPRTREFTVYSQSDVDLDPLRLLQQKLLYFSDNVLNYNSTIALSRFSKIHVDSLISLIRTDVQERDGSDHEIITLPHSYLTALGWIDSILIKLKLNNDPLLPLVRLILKRESLPAIVESLKVSTSLPQRDIVDIKRRVERCLSNMMITFMSYRITRYYGFIIKLHYSLTHSFVLS